MIDSWLGQFADLEALWRKRLERLPFELGRLADGQRRTRQPPGQIGDTTGPQVVVERGPGRDLGHRSQPASAEAPDLVLDAAFLVGASMPGEVKLDSNR